MTSAPSRGRGRRRVGLRRFAATVVTDYAFVWRVHLVPRSGRVVPARWRHGDRAPVLLLPGVYETWRHLRLVGERLSDLGHPVVVVPGMRHNRQPIPETAEAAQRILDAHDLRGVVVVAHSKGGLVGKSMMVGTDVDGRIDRMVAVNSPFSGTRWSRVLPNPALRAFSPSDAALLQLAEQLEANERVTRWRPASTRTSPRAACCREPSTSRSPSTATSGPSGTRSASTWSSRPSRAASSARSAPTSTPSAQGAQRPDRLAGRSTCAKCPQPTSTVVRASGSRARSRTRSSGWANASSAPATTATGQVIRAQAPVS